MTGFSPNENQGPNEYYHAILRAALDGFLVVDTQGRILEVNDAYCCMSGYTREELLAMRIQDIDAMETPEETAEHIRKAAETGYDRFESRHRCKDGRVIDVKVSSNYLERDGGRFVAFIRDITGYKQAQAEIERERAHLLSILDSMTAAVGITDPITYRILYVNRTTRQMYNKDLVGGLCYQELRNEESPCKFCPNEMLLKEPARLYHSEYYNPVVDRHFMFVDKMIKWPDGRDVKLRLGTDITEQKRLQAELDKAERFEALGNLARAVAHDFNNIMTIVMGNVSLLRRGCQEQPALLSRLADIERATKQARQLIQQLQTLARGKEPTKRLIPIGSWVKEQTILALADSGIGGEFHIEQDLVPVEIDESQLSQVVNNLVINAVQAMPGGGKLRVQIQNASVEAQDIPPLKAGKYVKISFQDEGVGIPEKHLQDIFYPYFTTKEKGSGLGLATCYSIINKHGGHITVESRVGTGTTFHVYLPASPGIGGAGDRPS